MRSLVNRFQGGVNPSQTPHNERAEHGEQGAEHSTKGNERLMNGQPTTINDHELIYRVYKDSRSKYEATQKLWGKRGGKYNKWIDESVEVVEGS